MNKKELKELFDYCNIEYPSAKIKAFKKMKLDQQINFKRLLLLVKNGDTYFLKEKKKKDAEGYFNSVYECKEGEVLGHVVIYKKDNLIEIDIIKVYNTLQGHGKLFMSKIEDYSKLKNVTRLELGFDRSCISYCANFYTTVGFLPDEEYPDIFEVIEGKTVLKKDINHTRMYKNIGLSTNFIK